MNSTRPVPVFMFHSVGKVNKKWKWNFLTTPYEIFEKNLIFLKNENYNTISLDDLYSYTHEKSKIPKKSIIITFDDGYLDNYVYAFPLLKKYGFKATIFVNPEFVDKRKIVRKCYDEVDFNSDSPVTGFLSWEEMKIMESENIIDIQSHALTHDWYAISDKIIDFRDFNDSHIWMTWNKFRSIKFNLQTDNNDLIKRGTPVFESGKSLSSKICFPDEKITNDVLAFIKSNGQELFFEQKNWKSLLFKFYDNKKNRNFYEDPTYESYAERILRISNELKISKDIIENKLNKKVDYLCWPGGSSTPEGIEIAKKVGYKMSTAGNDLNKKERKEIFNNGKKRKNRIARISTLIFQNNKTAVYGGGFIMKLRIKSFNENKLIRLFFSAITIFYGKLIYILKYSK